MKVLCVVPRFAPSNAPDAHRVRLLVPHLLALGHQVEVLAADPHDTGNPRDDWLQARLPAGLRVHFVRAPRWRVWGLGGLAQRAWWPMRQAGDRLLAAGRFDLVFFSTTDFLLHGLGLRWRVRWGVPFCMDYQDPWVTDYYARRPQVRPPGGRLKYALKSWLDRFMERRVVRGCGGFMAVSRAYLDELADRYGPGVRGKPLLVAGFPGEPSEFEGLPGPPPAATGPALWRYVGRAGAVMATAVNAFLGAWRQAIARGLLGPEAVRFEAVGTSYAVGEGPSIEPVARSFGLGGQVTEQTQRVGYRAALELLASSDALVIFGSDDPAYAASKIYPYLLAGRPVLAIFHADSPVVPLVRRVGGAVLVTFDAATPPGALADEIVRRWFAVPADRRAVPLDAAAFEPCTARAQAAQVAAWWREVVAHPHED